MNTYNVSPVIHYSDMKYCRVPGLSSGNSDSVGFTVQAAMVFINLDGFKLAANLQI